jgi:serine phosphatase RsbU (regulator of sigma subunit)
MTLLLALVLAFGLDISRSALGWELTGVAISVVLLAAGLAGMTLFAFRRKSRDFSLLYFGSFSILYAVRLLFREGLIRSLFSVRASVWDHLDVVIDCVIAIPFTLFLMQLVSDRWKKALRWLLAAQIAFGAARWLSDVTRIGERGMKAGNNIFVLGCCLLLAVYYFISRREKPTSHEIKTVLAGMAIFAAFVIEGNLAELRLLPRHQNIEPVGFLIFVCCLGYVAAQRTLAREERLLAINQELQIANQIQSSILPREAPRIAGLEIAARYVPMSAVAGDFYDFLLVDDQRIGILIADVTGHGVPAALIASMLKIAFVGQAGHANDPGRVLAGLNHALCGKFEEHFVTAAYIFLDLEKLVLRYAGAGHPALLLARFGAGNLRETEARELEANGLMLGLFPEATYAPVEIQLEARDRLLLYTDGISEAMSSTREEFGKVRLKAFLSSSTASSAASFADALLSELRRWSATDSGRAQDDDITLLVLDFPRSIPQLAN